MKTIKLSSKKIPIIVDDDFDDGGHTWSYNKGYFSTTIRLPVKRFVRLSRFIMKAKPREFVYFRNGDKHDLRRENMYIGPGRSNKDFMKRHVPTTRNPYRGVTLQWKKWAVYIGTPTIDEYGYKTAKTCYFGSYSNPEDAARVWDYFSEVLNGPGKYKNFPKEAT